MYIFLLVWVLTGVATGVGSLWLVLLWRTREARFQLFAIRELIESRKAVYQTVTVSPALFFTLCCIRPGLCSADWLVGTTALVVRPSGTCNAVRITINSCRAEGNMEFDRQIDDVRPCIIIRESELFPKLWSNSLITLWRISRGKHIQR